MEDVSFFPCLFQRGYGSGWCFRVPFREIPVCRCGLRFEMNSCNSIKSYPFFVNNRGCAAECCPGNIFIRSFVNAGRGRMFPGMPHGKEERQGAFLPFWSVCGGLGQKRYNAVRPKKRGEHPSECSPPNRCIPLQAMEARPMMPERLFHENLTALRSPISNPGRRRGPWRCRTAARPGKSKRRRDAEPRLASGSARS